MTDRAFGTLPPAGEIPGFTPASAQPEEPVTSLASVLLAETHPGQDTSQVAVLDRYGNSVVITPSDFPKSPIAPGLGLTLGDRMNQFRPRPGPCQRLAARQASAHHPARGDCVQGWQILHVLQHARRRYAGAGARAGLPEHGRLWDGCAASRQRPAFLQHQRALLVCSARIHRWRDPPGSRPWPRRWAKPSPPWATPCRSTPNTPWIKTSARWAPIHIGADGLIYADADPREETLAAGK